MHLCRTDFVLSEIFFRNVEISKAESVLNLSVVWTEQKKKNLMILNKCLFS